MSQRIHEHAGNLYSETVEKLEQFGMISGNGISGGIQVDINSVRKKLEGGGFQDAAYCDHNCRIKTNGEQTGHYDCPAAFSLNKGLDPKTLAPVELLLQGIQTTADGVRQFNQTFLKDGFRAYTDKYHINGMERDVLAAMLSSEKIEVNCFGGNPELHPELLQLIAGLKDFNINLTTTGGIFMRKEEFVGDFFRAPPKLIALSADDFLSADHIKLLNQLSLDEIKTNRNKIPGVFGQQRKAYEAVYVAKLAQSHDNFPQILFNLVVHENNLGSIEEIIETLRREFPGVIVNTYPAQSAFWNKEAIFNTTHIVALEAFIDKRIEEHMVNRPGIVPRLNYWLMLKAVFETYRNDPGKVLMMSSGYDTWHCFKQSGAGRYVQVGASPEIHQRDKIPGGNLNCFWNSQTIAKSDIQVWDDDFKPKDVVIYMDEGAKKLADIARNPCPGCLMPRLTFDMISTELGMDDTLVPKYLDLRKQMAGF